MTQLRNGRYWSRRRPFVRDDERGDRLHVPQIGTISVSYSSFVVPALPIPSACIL
jgi:hypothetical protein